MNPAELFHNVLRAMLFGFICGVLFTILFMITTYTIADAGLKSAIFEDRFMNYLDSNPTVSITQITRAQFVELMTQAAVNEQKSDRMGLRVRLLDPLTKKLLVPTPKDYALQYDPSGIREDYFPATSANPGDVLSNYAGVQTYRLYTDYVTGVNYLLEFQFIDG